MDLTRRLVRGAAILAAGTLFLGAPVAAAAQQGTIQGRVVDARSGTPIASAQVSVVGTQRGTLTDAQGEFRLPGIPAGSQQVQVSFIGFRASTQTVNVVAAQSATVNFQLAQSAVALDELIVTGTAGRQERRAQAASVSTLDAASITEIAPVTSVANLLQARSAGVSITTSSGSSGGAQRIRLRGSASINLSNEPLVIIDGIRMNSGNTQVFGVGGQTRSRLNDINPEDIESIEIVKGPAAATLYGADASAGVIQIRTKRGRAGSGFTQTFSYEYADIDPDFTPPANFGVCSASHVADSRRELCFGQAAGTIVSDNPLVRYNAFSNGNANKYGYTARGGGEQYGYFFSLNVDEEQGTLPSNEFNRYNGRVNFDFTPTSNLRFDMSLGLSRVDTQLPNNDNNIYGFLGGGLLGSPLSVGGFANDGWYAGNRQVEAITNIYNADMAVRTTPVFTVNYNPLPWFSHRLNVGVDMTRTEATSFWPKNDIGWYGTATLNSGQISHGRRNRDEITLDYLGSARRPIMDNLVADVAFGLQAVATRSDLTNATGQGLTTNTANSINAAAVTTGGQTYGESREGGVFGQLDLAWRDRVYFQLGGRLDRNSAFGADVDTFFNPKLGVSYVISDEDFYPLAMQNLLSTLRLRTVWGSTGRSPGGTASLTTFSSSAYAITSSNVASGVVPRNPGNAALRPERGVELELGFDAGLFNERIGLEVTYYNKASEDLILERPIPSSIGFIEDPLVNIGELENRGWEVGLNSRLLEVNNFAWDARLNFSTNENEVTDLGDVEPFGTTLRVQPGYPAFGYWTHKIQSFDVANNRAIVSDTMEFVGNPNPGFEGNFSSTFTLFNNLRVYGQIDWMSDYILYNNTDQFRERQFGTGERWVRRNEILTDQERLERFGPHFTQSGDALNSSAVRTAYYEDGDHVRFRELTLSYTLPGEFSGRFGARSATVSLGMRNVALWTDYNGFDPEVLGANTDFSRNDFLTVPQPKRLVARVNVTF